MRYEIIIMIAINESFVEILSRKNEEDKFQGNFDLWL